MGIIHTSCSHHDSLTLTGHVAEEGEEGRGGMEEGGEEDEVGSGVEEDREEGREDGGGNGGGE